MKLRVQRAGAGDAPWAVLCHGFARSGAHLQGLADALAARGVATVRPDLGALNWFRSPNNARYLDHLVSRLAPIVGSGAVLVGHSAGAAVAAYCAPRLDACAGIVMVDGVENPTHHIERNWADLRDIPIIAIGAPPNPCNRRGLLDRQLSAWGFTGLHGVVTGAGHGDIEDGNPWITRAVCGSRSTAKTKGFVRDCVVWSTCTLLGVQPDLADPWRDPRLVRM